MSLAPLPVQPADVPWPTTAFPTGSVSGGSASAAFQAAADAFFALPAAEGATRALLAVRRGRLIYERYGPETGAATTLQSWSVAKSITHALCGLLVADGRLDPAAPAAVPAWHAVGDPRAAVTLDQLLQMRSGLAFVEEYDAASPSDTIEMLWGSGRDDVAAYAAARPLEHGPGETFSYSSGTTNIICAILRDLVGGGAEGMRAFMQARLFEPLGMRSPVPKFDGAGTFKGSSYCFCTARDFARFGLLYLRDGLWEGERILPAGWVDHARRPTHREAERGYGAHWWLDPDGDAFYASGHEGQRIYLDPQRDLVLVRLGITPEAGGPRVHERLRRLAQTLAPAGA